MGVDHGAGRDHTRKASAMAKTGLSSRSWWWRCDGCDSEVGFQAAVGSRGVAHFILDTLTPSDWNQSTLVVDCQRCGAHKLRIRYEFPRASPEFVTVLHIVGVGPDPTGYLPMLWETRFDSDPEGSVFDFKYLNGRSTLGLTKPAVVSQDQLRRLLRLYRERTGVAQFP